MNTASVSKSPEHLSRWLVLALVSIGTFMSTLDASILNVALPTLTRAFHTSRVTSEWFVLIYSFVVTILLLTFGKLSDQVGRKRLYTCGTLVFVGGSLFCALSVSSLMMIFARAFQGVGSAITMSSGNALITQASPPSERGKSLGLIGAAVAIGLLTGPVLGGVIIQHASWHWMFLINVPIGLIQAVLLWKRIPGLDVKHKGRMDMPGNILMALAITSVLCGLTFGQDLGWVSLPSISIFAAAIIFGAAFISVERRAVDPLLDLRLFRHRDFSMGAIAGWSSYASTIPIAVFLPFYLQNLLGYHPQQVGLMLATGPLTLAFVAPIAGSLSDKMGSRLLSSLGLLIAAIGLFSMRTLTPHSSAFDVIWRFVIANFGTAIFVSPNSSSIMGSVRKNELGIAAGTIALVRNLGMVCGLAFGGAVIKTVEKGFSGASASSNMAFFAGLKIVFVTSAALSLIGSFVSTFKSVPETE